jgi:hypothetical protein
MAAQSTEGAGPAGIGFQGGLKSVKPISERPKKAGGGDIAGLKTPDTGMELLGIRMRMRSIIILIPRSVI